MAASSICNFYKFGYCKFGGTCRKRHFSERCENSSCEIFKCEKRHPRECKYFREYSRCKFGDDCQFYHKAAYNSESIGQENAMKAKILTLETNFNEVTKKLDNKEIDIENLKLKLEKFEETLEKVIQSEVLKLTNLIIESTVKAVVAEFEKKQAEIEKTNASKLDDLRVQILQLSNLFQSFPNASQNCDTPPRPQVPQGTPMHQYHVPRGPPPKSSAKR